MITLVSWLGSQRMAGCRHPKTWWGQDPFRMLSDICTPGLCMVNPPAPLPASALATLPATTQSPLKPESTEHALAIQLQLHQETKQVGDDSHHSCTLQVTLSLGSMLGLCNRARCCPKVSCYDAPCMQDSTVCPSAHHSALVLCDMSHGMTHQCISEYPAAAF